MLYEVFSLPLEYRVVHLAILDTQSQSLWVPFLFILNLLNLIVHCIYIHVCGL